MAAEGEAKNPSGGCGGGGGGVDNPQVEVAPAEGEAVVAAAQGTGQGPEGEKADREGEKDDGACRDLVLVEDPEVVAVEDPEEGTVPVLAEVLPGHGRCTSRC